MNVSTHNEAEWHAATDRYARAILSMESGDPKAREEMLEAYRQLQAHGPDQLVEPIARLSPQHDRFRDHARRALRGLSALVEARYGPAGFLS